MPVPGEIQRVFAEWEARDRREQAPVAWQRERWLQRLPELAPQLEALPAELDRQAVRDIVSAKPITTQGMFDAMIVVYAWGWSTTPVGIRRAGRVLSAGPQVVGSRLLAVRARVVEGGALDAYWSLARAQRVPWLGPAFGTKFLYFVSPDGARALILDDIVSSWLRQKVGVTIASSRWVRSG